ncbi:MAG TPA: exodeoxyribonuclease III [Polyangiaceae bacterium]
MKIATFNVNGIRARVEQVCGWLSRTGADVLCMQETKVVDGDFPFEPFARIGYALAVAGQPGYNGVAIAARRPLADVKIGLFDDSGDSEKRALFATVDGVRVANVYVPNGKGVELPSFREKLRWLERLRVTLDASAHPDDELCVCGDFNVARDERDVFDPVLLRGKLHFHPEERRALARVLDFGLCDAFRELSAEAGRFSWWDYRGGDFRSNRGLRIDYVLLTHKLAARLERAEIDVAARREPKASDHAPVLIELASP